MAYGTLKPEHSQQRSTLPCGGWAQYWAQRKGTRLPSWRARNYNQAVQKRRGDEAKENAHAENVQTRDYVHARSRSPRHASLTESENGCAVPAIPGAEHVQLPQARHAQRADLARSMG